MEKGKFKSKKFYFKEQNGEMQLLANVSTFEAVSVEARGRQSLRTLKPQTFFLIIHEVALINPYGNCSNSN